MTPIFDPAKVTITRKRRSTTQGEVLVEYDGRPVAQFGDNIQMNRFGEWEGASDHFWVAAARRYAFARGWVRDAFDDEIPSRLARACGHLTEPYLAPVPSQFTAMHRAMHRAQINHDARNAEEFEPFGTLGYCRALADDCFAWTGCLDAPRTA